MISQTVTDDIKRFIRKFPPRGLELVISMGESEELEKFAYVRARLSVGEKRADAIRARAKRLKRLGISESDEEERFVKTINGDIDYLEEDNGEERIREEV